MNRLLILYILFALCTRMIFLIVNHPPVFLDQRDYDALAVSIAQNGSYSINGVPTAYRSPGYPVFLAMIYGIAGHSIILAKGVQSLLDAVTAYILFLIARRTSNISAHLAALLWTFFIPAILFANLLLTESISAFLLTLFFFLFLKYTDSFSLTRLALSGIVLGILILVKPIVFPFLLLLPWVIKNRIRRVKHWFVLASITLALLFPWAIRNSHALGVFALSTNSGINLIVGNNPQATGAYLGTIPAALFNEESDEATRDRLAFSIAWRYILDNPSRFIFNGFRKLAHLFRSEGEVLIASFADNSASEGISFSARYKSVFFPLALVTNLSSLTLLLGGLAGFLASKRSILFQLTSTYALSTLLVHFIFFGGSRFHFLIMPLAALFLARCVETLVDGSFSMTTKRTIVFLLSSIGLTGMWVYELVAVYSL